MGKLALLILAVITTACQLPCVGHSGVYCCMVECREACAPRPVHVSEWDSGWGWCSKCECEPSEPPHAH
jgi:hypothetical protein